MARRAEEAENHWPGFVDVLSTIVMVVTFLLIILGIVIFVISKNISTELAKSAAEVEAAQVALAEAQSEAHEARKEIEARKQAEAPTREQSQNRKQAKAQAAQKVQAKSSEKVDQKQQSDEQEKSPSARQEKQQKQEKQKTKQQKSKSEARKTASRSQSSAPTKQSAASFRTQFSDELTQQDEVKGREKLSVRTRQTDNTRQIVVSTTEQETSHHKIRVTTSTAVLSLLFKGGVQISDDAAREVQNYLKENAGESTTGKYEVRAFFNTEKGSISEAKRLAYYRALATRNQLLELGIEARNISIKVGNSERLQDAGKVNIYLK